ncbi:MAG: PIN domain-containing protein [Acidobacteriaceae bacterium]
MLLVDACVWSLSLRRRPGAAFNTEQQHLLSELQQAIGEGRVSLLGAIRQEVLSGVRDKALFLKIRRLLAPFPDEDVIPADYVEAARLYNLCLDGGVQCGSIDMLIAAVAERKNFTVLTYDRALIRCLEVLEIPRV